MNNKENKKLMIKVNENSFFYKIKRIFKNLFNKKTKGIEDNGFEIERQIVSENNTRNSFIENIKDMSENEETKLMNLQKQFENGQIIEEQLSVQQRFSLSELYDKQIADLRKSNELRKKRLLEYKMKTQMNS